LNIYCADALSEQEQRHVLRDLGGVLQKFTEPTADETSLFFLSFHKSVLSLKKKQSKEHGIQVDFYKEQKNYQSQKLSRKKDLLARAVGVEPGLRVCDLTLGLAGDAFKLSYLGAQVVGYEENQMVWALVQNALWRTKKEGLSLTLKALHLNFEEKLEQELSQQDVFYMDPMYAHERRSLPRKEMQYLAEMLLPSDDNRLANSIDTILAAHKKLVIKRAPQSGPLANRKPQRSIEGKMVRFDVYGK
jgi:16S rRNA (guanine1516-N2)-methyltransferase